MHDGFDRDKWMKLSSLMACVMTASPNAKRVVTPDEFNPYVKRDDEKEPTPAVPAEQFISILASSLNCEVK